MRRAGEPDPWLPQARDNFADSIVATHAPQTDRAATAQVAPTGPKKWWLMLGIRCSRAGCDTP